MNSVEFCKIMNFDHFVHAIHDGEWMILPLQNIQYSKWTFWEFHITIEWDQTLSAYMMTVSYHSKSRSRSDKAEIGRIRPNSAEICADVAPMCFAYNLNLDECYHFLSVIQLLGKYLNEIKRLLHICWLSVIILNQDLHQTRPNSAEFCQNLRRCCAHLCVLHAIYT